MQKNHNLCEYIKNNTFRCIVFACILCMILKIVLINIKSGDYTSYLSVWYDYLKENGGFSAIPSVESDYNAIYLYFLALFTYLPINDLYLIKMLSFIFDIILATGAYKLVNFYTKDKENTKFYGFLAFAGVLFMPTAFINSAIWCQCDCIYTAFIVWAFYSLIKGKSNLAFILYGLAITFKLQAIFILPAFGIIYLKNRNFSIFKFLWVPITNFIAFIPAILCGCKATQVYDAYICQMGEYSYKTVLGYPNIYYFFDIENTALIKPGIILTMVILFSLMFYVLFTKGKLSNIDMLELSVLVLFLVTYFLPEMHDRYGYSAEIMSLLYFIIIKKDYIILLLININALITYISFTSFYPEELMFIISISQGVVVIYMAYTFIKKRSSLKKVAN